MLSPKASIDYPLRFTLLQIAILCTKKLSCWYSLTQSIDFTFLNTFSRSSTLEVILCFCIAFSLLSTNQRKKGKPLARWCYWLYYGLCALHFYKNYSTQDLLLYKNHWNAIQGLCMPLARKYFLLCQINARQSSCNCSKITHSLRNFLLREMVERWKKTHR